MVSFDCGVYSKWLVLSDKNTSLCRTIYPEYIIYVIKDIV